MRSVRSLLRRRRARAAAGAERDARLRWVAVRHDDVVVLTNRGASTATEVHLSVSADGRTAAEGARVLPDVVAAVATGAHARVVCPLSTDTLWLGVEWTDPRHGPQRTVLRTDVFPRPER